MGSSQFPSKQIGYSYDAAGNMSNDGFHSYTYDGEGNITAVDGGSWQYVYDALNHRVRTQWGSSFAESLYDAFGRRTSDWSAASPNESHIFWEGLEIAFRSGNGVTFFQHKDWVNSDRMQSDAGGATAATLTSQPFGDGDAMTASEQDAGWDFYHFADMGYHLESGLHEAQYRQYSSAQGRWMSPDPYDGSYDFSNPQSFNRYSDVLNNPLSMTDPLGLNPPVGSGGYTDCGNDPLCTPYNGGSGGGGGIGEPWFGSCCGVLGGLAAQEEASWLASGSIPWYSVSASGDLLQMFWLVTANPLWNGDISGNPSSDLNSWIADYAKVSINDGPLWSGSNWLSYASSPYMIGGATISSYHPAPQAVQRSAAYYQCQEGVIVKSIGQGFVTALSNLKGNAANALAYVKSAAPFFGVMAGESALYLGYSIGAASTIGATASGVAELGGGMATMYVIGTGLYEAYNYQSNSTECNNIP